MAHATARVRELPADLDRTVSITPYVTAAAIQIQALVDVTHARIASSAASFMRPRTAASAPAIRSAVSIGSTTAEPDVNRNTGLSTSRATARRAWRTFGASV